MSTTLHRFARRLVPVLAGVVLGVCSTAVLAAGQIYLAPDGADDADGKSARSAVATMGRAVERAKELLSKSDSEVEVLVADGRYKGQHTAFEGLPEGKQLQIRAAQQGKRPVFDGDGGGGTWMVIQAKHGEAGNVRITGLEISNYAVAIALTGSRDDDAQRVVNIELRNNVFRRIGQIAKPDGAPSAAAVRLVNADRVKVVGNRFVEIKNIQRCTSLHALYFAHGSTDGLVEDNRFEDSCGDTIRFRDGSGNNRVVGNTFVDSWAKAPITDWYCDSDSREDCTKASAECPSWSNLVENNKVRSESRKALPPTTMTYGADDSASCREKAKRAGSSKRFVTR